METPSRSSQISPAPDLETFLGGMETPPDCVVQVINNILETFLGGMETHPPIPPTPGARGALETFLGGMETRLLERRGGGRELSLKPSLVEWKQEETHGSTTTHYP